MREDSIDVIVLEMTVGDQGIRFAGPDLLDYHLVFNITGGLYDGERLLVDSSYHVCCGTLEVITRLLGKYARWQNKMDGCSRHRSEGGGDNLIKDLIWNFTTKIWRNDDRRI